MTTACFIVDAPAVDMEIANAPLPAFIEATPVGLRLSKDLTFDEWSAIASSFGKALQTAAWCIGDWLVYGERKWGQQLLLDGDEFDPDAPNRIPSHAYDAAVSATGLDRQTLSQYAGVCRKIPMEERRLHVSFGHHRILAPLPPAKRLEWWALLDSESKKELPSVKRLALSVRCAVDEPRILRESDLRTRGEQAGQENYIPHLTRLVTVLRKAIPLMTADQRKALKADFGPLLEVLKGV
jgi:hypothetical protein